MPVSRSLSSAASDALVADARALYRTAVRSVQADRLLPSDVLSDVLNAAPDAVHIAALGKAALAMTGVVEQHLASRSVPSLASGRAVVPRGYRDTLPEGLPEPSVSTVVEGGHPLPTDASARAGRDLLASAEACGPDALLLVLISGGGTALTSAPAGDLYVSDLRTTYQLMLNGGVRIQDANVVRKHLTQVGGGQLARAAAPARVVALVVSDVPGDDRATIASGPTVPDPSTYADAMRVLYRNDLWHNVPARVRDHLAAGANKRRPETPSAADPCFERTETRLVGTNQTALDAMRDAAEARGYHVAQVETGVEGEAREVGARRARAVSDAAPDAPTCWLWGGEPTVTVTGDGTGGRNQEVALGAALEWHDCRADAVVLSGDTDGIDGPTDAAGAWATPTTVQDARSLGLDPADHLARNDAYAVFDALGTLLRPGPTHTNVMDIGVALARPHAS